MPDTFTPEVTARHLQHARWQSDGSYRASCPACNGGPTTLEISEKDGKLLWHCFAGCSQEAVAEALRASGALPKAPPKTPAASHPRALAGHSPLREYAYTDKSGETVFYNCRYPDGVIDGKYRPWSKSGSAWRCGGTPPMPYRWQTWQPATVLIATEGERDADTLGVLGYSTTNLKGWKKSWNPKLASMASIIAIGDADGAGDRQVNGFDPGREVLRYSVSEISGDNGCKDITELHAKIGGVALKAAISELIKLDQTADAAGTVDKHNKLEGTSLMALVPEPRKYSWKPYFPRGGLVTICGPTGSAKTTLTSAFCAWASVGHFPTFDDGYNIKPLRSIIYNKQDDYANEIKPRLVANGYNHEFVRVPVCEDRPDMPTIADIEYLVTAFDIIVISQADQFVLRCGVKNINDGTEVEPILDKLSMLGEKNDCLIIIEKHPNKKGDQSQGERVGGAGAFISSPRTVTFTAFDRESGVRLFDLWKAQRSKTGKWRMSLEDLDPGPMGEWSASLRVNLLDAEPDDSIEAMWKPKPAINDQQQDVVDFLSENRGDFSFKELATKLGRQAPTMKTQLYRLVKRGRISAGKIPGTFRHRDRG